MKRVAGSPAEGSQIDHNVWFKLKNPFRIMLEIYDRKTPELMVNNTMGDRNTRNILYLKDWFFSHFDLPDRAPALNGLAKFFIIHFVTDRPYKLWFLAVLREAVRLRWDFPDQKPYYWKECFLCSSGENLKIHPSFNKWVCPKCDEMAENNIP